MHYQDMLPNSLIKSLSLAAALVALAGPLSAQAQDEAPGAEGASEQVAATGEAAESSTSGSTVDNMIEKSKELMEAGSEKAKEGWDKTKEVSGEAWDATKEVSGKAWDKTKEVSGEAWDATKETASKVGAATKSGYEAAKKTYQESGTEGEDAGATQ
jgi:hypothetical protein